ncbi:MULTISPECIES: LysM domain-containing protein [unclassified Caballeronia]|uniref:LysM peptidoglycan-binding domain-containing protein n=2 Tax=unclassified Caballeronia TaxID=2646786 RepID=UPI0020299297|nr:MULTISPECIES: LysM domain-containing protein [unclassified Caballeronia]MDR5787329.1 LysM domain-containing protein [Caballeronia sp. LP003]
MADNSAPSFDKWRDGISAAVGDDRWNSWDNEVQLAVSEFNHHLIGNAGYRPLDWRIIKAMTWVESGANSSEWKKKPMQIGVAGDPGLSALLSAKEGGDLILPPAWKSRLTVASVRADPLHNIRAGVGYLLMRSARFEYRSVLDGDSRTFDVTVKAGDSLEKIAKAQGSTVDVLKSLNPAANILRSGQILKCRKASIGQVITGWRPINSAMIANRYNGGGDSEYAKKFDYVWTIIAR